MALKLFNTLTRSVQEFVPLSLPQVGMYCCGPTVHDFAHIGNFRTFVFADLVRRWLEFKGHAVKHVMNITDVEDKIIARIRERNAIFRLTEQQDLSTQSITTSIAGEAVTVPRSYVWTLADQTRRFEAAFLEDLKTLGCLTPHLLPRATEHIPEIIALIEKLLARGVAYQAADGSVYFSIEKYRGCGCKYGQLVNLNFDGMRAGERVASDEYEKESLADFALWKARVPEDGAVAWPSPWGEGRPGWHIECSAMSMRHLGASFDLHLGGEDLMFPHHEDEIAQSEGATGQPFVRHWMHGSHLLVEGKKMSKSLGNYFTLRDLLAKGFTGREIRYLLLTAHYREQFNFTMEGLQGARAALARIDECVGKLRELGASNSSSANAGLEANTPADLLTRFTAALNEDLNVSAAWGAVFDWVRETNRLLAAWIKLDSVFGLGTGGSAEAPPDLLALLDERQTARKAKDFKRSDAIRDELKAKGWAIEDTPKGPRLKRL
jgi:cysteinyl-tRNA synthetase